MYEFAKSLVSYFPETLPEPRPQQIKVFEQLHTEFPYENIRFHIVDAPVGTGKSAIVATAAAALADIGLKSVILTPTKFLQDEYSASFPFIPNIKGRGNYPCPKSIQEGHPVNADEAPCSAAGGVCPEYKSGQISCPYYDTKYMAKKSPTFVANFRYFILAKTQMQGLISKTYSDEMEDYSPDADDESPRRALIIDEAHNICNEVVSQVSFDLKPNMSNTPYLPNYKDAETYETFLRSCMDYCGDKSEEAGNKAMRMAGVARLTDLACIKGRLPETLKQYIRDYKYYSRCVADISRYFKACDRGVEWVVQDDENEKYRYRFKSFKPVNADFFTEKVLFSGFEKIILLSGTFLNPSNFKREIGIQGAGVSWSSIQHPFPVNRRPIYFVTNIASMSAKHKEAGLPRMAKYVAHLIDKTPNYKGVVFFNSKKDQLAMIDCIKIISPKAYTRIISAMTENKDDAILEHRNSERPTVLFANSLWEGVDLKGDQSRFQIITKIPFPSMGDPRVAKLKDIDPQWMAYQAVKKLCQGYGRSIRSVDDWAYTYTLDSTFANTYKYNHSMFPEWFHEALQPIAAQENNGEFV